MNKQTWAQIKSVTAQELINALRKDRQNGWEEDAVKGAEHVFLNKKNNRRVSIHFQPGKTYGPNLLKSLLEDIGWTDTDMRRLKLIK
jgi:predicted RNA binding protein YcfA (HicA-like mRNA interferase family)